MYYTYILLCADGTLYTGITTDAARRLAQHREGVGAKYTRSHRGERFLALWQSDTRAAASRLEYRIKRLSRAQKEQLIAGAALPEGVAAEDYRRLEPAV